MLFAAPSLSLCRHPSAPHFPLHCSSTGVASPIWPRLTLGAAVLVLLEAAAAAAATLVLLAAPRWRRRWFCSLWWRRCLPQRQRRAADAAALLQRGRGREREREVRCCSDADYREKCVGEEDAAAERKGPEERMWW